MNTSFTGLLKTCLLLGVLLGNPYWGHSQEKQEEFRALLTEESDSRWLKFKEPLSLEPTQFFTRYATELGLTTADELRWVKSRETNTEGYETHVYQQFHKGVKVVGAAFVAHVQDGKLKLLNGDLGQQLQFNVEPTLTPSDAFQRAAEHVGGMDLLSFDEDAESPRENQVMAPYPLVIITEKSAVFAQEGLHLAYKVDVSVREPLSFQDIYVDVHSGEIVKVLDHNLHACQVGTVNTSYDGVQDVTTNSTWEPFWSHFRLVSNCNGFDIETKTFRKFANNVTGNASRGNHLKDGDNTWGSMTNPHQGATAHWIMQEAWNYYDNTYNHQGLDGNGRGVKVFVQSPFPAVFRTNHDEIHIGAVGAQSFTQCGGGTVGFTTTDEAAVDILGHEFNHGVILHGGSLLQGGPNESGALGEGFSDIFGAMIERQVGSNNADIWTNGEDVTNSTVYQRSMANPNGFSFRTGGPACVELGLADEYLEPGFWDATGGPHANSNVIGHWFFLLVTGNTHQNGTAVTGIGFDDAALIAFNTMLMLPPNGGYADARNLAITYAEATFGFCSPQHVGTIQAFNAINVNPAPIPGQNINTVISGNSFTLCTDDVKTYFVNGVAGATYQWNVSAGLQIISQIGTSCTVKKTNSSASTISCTISTSCDADTDTRTINGSNTVQPPTPILYSNDYYLCPNQTYQVFVQNPQPNTTYQWSGSGTIIPSPTGTSCNFIPSGFGYAYVSAVALTTCGTSYPGVVNFQVDPGHWSCGWGYREGLEVETPFTLAPNPATAQVWLSYQAAHQVEILDVNGKVVLQQALDPQGTEQKLSLHALAPGIYFVRLRDAQTTVIGLEKLLVQ